MQEVPSGVYGWQVMQHKVAWEKYLQKNREYIRGRIVNNFLY